MCQPSASEQRAWARPGLLGPVSQCSVWDMGQEDKTSWGGHGSSVEAGSLNWYSVLGGCLGPEVLAGWISLSQACPFSHCTYLQTVTGPTVETGTGTRAWRPATAQTLAS